MNAADPRSQPLFEMSQCAYRLGMAFGAEAERADAVREKVEWYQLFERCFFACRVATALELRLRRAPAEPREAESDREDLIERPEPPEGPERDARERGYDERDREGDREIERASFPLLVRTLEGVAAEAAALPGPEPADLPTLRELLAHVASEPRTLDAAPDSPRQPACGLRARLAGSSGAVSALCPSPRARRRARSPAPLSGPLFGRRATGPPRR